METIMNLIKIRLYRPERDEKAEDILYDFCTEMNEKAEWGEKLEPWRGEYSGAQGPDGMEIAKQLADYTSEKCKDVIFRIEEVDLEAVNPQDAFFVYYVCNGDVNAAMGVVSYPKPEF